MQALRERLIEYIEILPDKKLIPLEPLFRLLLDDDDPSDPFNSEANQARLLKAAADMRAGVNAHIHEISEAGND